MHNSRSIWRPLLHAQILEVFLLACSSNPLRYDALAQRIPTGPTAALFFRFLPRDQHVSEGHPLPNFLTGKAFTWPFHTTRFQDSRSSTNLVTSARTPCQLTWGFPPPPPKLLAPLGAVDHLFFNEGMPYPIRLPVVFRLDFRLGAPNKGFW